MNEPTVLNVCLEESDDCCVSSARQQLRVRALSRPATLDALPCPEVGLASKSREEEIVEFVPKTVVIWKKNKFDATESYFKLV